MRAHLATEGRNGEIAADNAFLQRHGISYFSRGALPYHVPWIRKDIVAIITLLTEIRRYLRLMFAALLGIAAILIFGRFR
jgi:hypothetical protein